MLTADPGSRPAWSSGTVVGSYRQPAFRRLLARIGLES
jgi:hypothetical protein